MTLVRNRILFQLKVGGIPIMASKNWFGGLRNMGQADIRWIRRRISTTSLMLLSHRTQAIPGSNTTLKVFQVFDFVFCIPPSLSARSPSWKYPVAAMGTQRNTRTAGISALVSSVSVSALVPYLSWRGELLWGSLTCSACRPGRWGSLLSQNRQTLSRRRLETTQLQQFIT